MFSVLWIQIIKGPDNRGPDNRGSTVIKTHIIIIIPPPSSQVCNPIGSSAKKHKLGTVLRIVRIVQFTPLNLLCTVGAFYFLLGNIQPALRSSLKVIQLVTMVKQSLINYYGIDKILEPFMESIQQLESVSNSCSFRLGGVYL